MHAYTLKRAHTNTQLQCCAFSCLTPNCTSVEKVCPFCGWPLCGFISHWLYKHSMQSCTVEGLCFSTLKQPEESPLHFIWCRCPGYCCGSKSTHTSTNLMFVSFGPSPLLHNSVPLSTSPNHTFTPSDHHHLHAVQRNPSDQEVRTLWHHMIHAPPMLPGQQQILPACPPGYVLDNERVDCTICFFLCADLLGIQDQMRRSGG